MPAFNPSETRAAVEAAGPSPALLPSNSALAKVKADLLH